MMDLVAAFKALGHPTRLRILDTLMSGMHCNCELAAQFACPLSLISYHLRILQEAGLVHAERDADDARWIYYTVDPPALGRLLAEASRLLDPSRIEPRVPQCGPRRGENC